MERDGKALSFTEIRINGVKIIIQERKACKRSQKDWSLLFGTFQSLRITSLWILQAILMVLTTLLAAATTTRLSTLDARTNHFGLENMY